MRLHEFAKPLTENSGLGVMIEDEVDVRGDVALATALEELRNRAQNHSIPRVRVDALINLVKRLPGGETFTASALNDARSTNDAVRNLIKDIKDDENGVKYVYLNSVETEPEDEDTRDTDTPAASSPAKDNKTVAAMASRAAKS